MEHRAGLEIAAAALAQELVAAADERIEPGRVVVEVGAGVAWAEGDRASRRVTDRRGLGEGLPHTPIVIEALALFDTDSG